MQFFPNHMFIIIYSSFLLQVSSSNNSSLDTSSPTPNISNTEKTIIIYSSTFGSLGFLLLLFGALRWYQYKKLTELRMKKLAMTTHILRETQALYGITPSSGIHVQVETPGQFVYTVATYPQPMNSLTASKKQMDAYKKSFAPKATN